MSAPIRPRRLYALEDCERLLAEHAFSLGDDDISVDVELFAELVFIARKARAWGA